MYIWLMALREYFPRRSWNKDEGSRDLWDGSQEVPVRECGAKQGQESNGHWRTVPAGAWLHMCREVTGHLADSGLRPKQLLQAGLGVSLLGFLLLWLKNI